MSETEPTQCSATRSGSFGVDRCELANSHSGRHCANGVTWGGFKETEPTREYLQAELAATEEQLVSRFPMTERAEASVRREIATLRLALEALDRRAELATDGNTEDTCILPESSPAGRRHRAQVATMTAQVAEQAQEIERLGELLAASEMYRKAYQEGKYKLYALSGDVAKAAFNSLPCSDGPLDRAVAKSALVAAVAAQWRATYDWLLDRVGSLTGQSRDDVWLEMSKAFHAAATDRDTPHLLTVRNEELQAKLRAVEALHANVLRRLARWAAANKRERQQGKSPTHLNAYTVALWLGVKEDELLAILTPEAQS